MSTIKKVIEYMETGDVPENPPTNLLEIVDKLRANPGAYLKFWESLTQFYTPKIQSTNYVPEVDNDEKDITITVVHG